MSYGKSRSGLPFGLRLGLFHAAVFILGYLGVVALADVLLRRTIADKEREIIAERLAEYRAWFRSGQREELRARFLEQSRDNPDLSFVRLAGPGGRTLLFSSPRDQQPLAEERLAELADTGEALVATLETTRPDHVWTVASSPLRDGLVLQAGRISTRAFEVAERFRRLALWALIPVALLALAGGGFLSHRALRPVRELTETARRIVATGRLDERVDPGRGDHDLARMARLFNRMLDRNQSLIRAMREALDNTAHDLRTPLARLRASAETGLAGRDPDAAREALADCLEESERVLTILNTLMDIAEAESGAMELERVELDFVELVRDLAELHQPAAEEAGIAIDLALPESLVLRADRTRLQQALANLLDNAIKYGRSRVRIELAAEAEEAVLRVRDDGPGIAAADLPRIWERLYRADRSRSKRGLGLGLSLVRAIALAHDGGVDATSEEGRGATFTLRLPLSS